MIDKRGDLLGKVLILGNSQVGKSSILNQFTEKTFSASLPPTLGIDYKISQVKVGEEFIKLQIWDTAGQEKFKSITENFYKGAQGIVLVFDLTDRDSFMNIRTWIQNIHDKAGPETLVCLVGNKLDLWEEITQTGGEEADKLTKEAEVEALVEEFSFKYLKVSAKTGINVEEVFNYLAGELLAKNVDLLKKHRGKGLKENKEGKEEEGKSDKGCC